MQLFGAIFTLLALLTDSSVSSFVTPSPCAITQKRGSRCWLAGDRFGTATKTRPKVVEEQAVAEKPALAVPSLLPKTEEEEVEEFSEEVEETEDKRALLVFGVAVLIGGLAVATNSNDVLVAATSGVNALRDLIDHPTEFMENTVEQVESLGTLGLLYFGVVYTVAEVLALPAFPLTASAGYLFGPWEGTGVVLLSASIAASVSFWIGRTILRSNVEGMLDDYPKLKALDKAFGKDGFRLMFLLRLSPLFPFALSNYVYGATSIPFLPFFWGTILGFAPGTMAYVYTGVAGKALTLDSVGEASSSQPWYIYAGGIAVLAAIIKVATEISNNVISEFEEEED